VNTPEHSPLAAFLNDMMRRRGYKASRFAAELGVSHATVSRWLHGRDTPSTRSCRRLADYCRVPIGRVLSISGLVPAVTESATENWPEFGEYARRKYPAELDEDLITMIENLIEQRRGRP
jgi:transcriptional regulator with XRE-family HTH domain